MAFKQQNSVNNLPGIVTIIFVVPILFFESVRSMVEVWIVNETFTHGFLIFPISLYLIWQKRNQINLYPARPEPPILILLIPALAAWMVSNIIDVQVVQQLVVVILIPLIVWLLYGRKILSLILFPLLYLLFAVPIGQGLIPVMMEFTANFTVTLIQITGIPIYRDGLFFSLPSGNWSIVEECSGVRYIIASLALGTIYAYINYTALYKRLIFILFAILVPVVANGLRAYGIVMIGHLSGMELATGADHLLYGWVFFGIVIFLMFYIGSFFWDTTTTDKTTSPGASSLIPETHKNKTLIILAVITITSIISVQFLANQSRSIEPTQDVINISIPDYFDEWQYFGELSLDWSPDIKNPDILVSRGYRYGGDMVQLDIAYYQHQRENAEAISSENRLTNPYDGEWKIIHETDLKDGDIYVTETVLQRAEQQILVWNWYQIGEKQTPNNYIAKAFEAYNQIILGRNDVALISIATPLEGDRDEARSRLSAFWDTASNNISTSISRIVTGNH